MEKEKNEAVYELNLKLWERRCDLCGVDNDIGYCKAMLINICRDRWRSKSLEPEWVTEEEDITAECHAVFETEDIKEKIEQFITRLPDKQRRIMTMRMQGATTEEIIDATGLSVENVRTILSRTRQLVRDYYKRINR